MISNSRLPSRVVVEGILPQVDCGRFPIKRVVGEAVIVSADIHADGHDVLAAVAMYRAAGEQAWDEVPMEATGNDRWQAAFTVEVIGEYEYTVEGWIDRFASWRHELSKKFGAGQDVSSELLEGAMLVRETLERVQETPFDLRERSAGPGHREVHGILSERAAALAETSTPPGERVALALSEELERLMTAHPDRSRATRFDRVLGVIVERVRARFGAWYEMFPRSAGTDASRSVPWRPSPRVERGNSSYHAEHAASRRSTVTSSSWR